MSCGTIARPAPKKRQHSPQPLTAYPLRLRLVFQRSLAATSCLQSHVPTRRIGLSVAVSLARPVHIRASRWLACPVPSGRKVSSAFRSHMARTCRRAPSSSWAERSSTIRPTWRFARLCNRLLPFAFEASTLVVPTLNKSLRFVCSSRYKICSRYKILLRPWIDLH